MNTSKFLLIILPVIAILALIILFLPEDAAGIYERIVEPAALFAGAFLAYRVSRIYSGQLNSTFVYLSLYLFLYALALVVIPLVQAPLGANFGVFVLAFQIINYAMLVLFCVSLLKVIDIRKLNLNGWLVFVATAAVSLFLAVYPLFEQGEWSLSVNTVSFTLVHIMDAVSIIILVPVIWLYIQYLKARQQQSLTFTIVIAGIIISTLFDYLFQAVTGFFPNLIPPGSGLYETIPETLYLAGYLIISAGLYAHTRQDEWGFNAIEKMLG